MNELDIILIFIILLGVGIGWRRGLVRVLISAVGVYFIVLVAGYAYKPFGDTLTGAMNRLDMGQGSTAAYNFSYIVVVAAMAVLVEVISRSTFERTRILAIKDLDRVLGALAGVYYGALWASLFLVPSQYGISQSGGAWTTAVYESGLVPTLNQLFESTVLDIVSILFVNGTPELLRNPVSQRVSALFFFFV